MSSRRKVFLIRHGRTEMNEWMASNPSSHDDPGFKDTVLTPAGEEGARKLADVAPEVDVVLASPLRRTLQTACLAYPNASIVAFPLAAERRWHSSDEGTPVEELEELFPQVDFSLVKETPYPWFHEGSKEPVPQFVERMCAFREALATREEEKVAVVCHWGVIQSLLNVSAANCEVVETSVDDLSPAPNQIGAWD
eukprot:CAMPEP_0204271646 /NCGR_PEP_ID=MMETSP0468-20130131/20600_1 /ASSEMBLY_ACC=CAM_ASM_000383 /TAXON_ID=2969 /ORGANISM="Oxyrrhis marina" /LENGTH=194 /DNA_ID=CAMNT_0051247371 /DNA_START=49 /DNA_END=633 /DNA_ORIENTATION=+